MFEWRRGSNTSMSNSNPIDIRRLTPDDVTLMEAMSAMFGEAFDEVEIYSGARPSKAYLERLLTSDYFIALAALKNGEVVGGIAAYEFVKFEQERSEIYIYDLAVAAAHRRNGIGTALIKEVQKIAATRHGHVVFVQAYAGEAPATALYSKFARREDVLHFEIEVNR